MIDLHDLEFAFDLIIVIVIAKLLLEALDLGCLWETSSIDIRTDSKINCLGVDLLRGFIGFTLGK
jgi:hypothetical protein